MYEWSRAPTVESGSRRPIGSEGADVQKFEEYQKVMEDLAAKQTELFNKCGFEH